MTRDTAVIQESYTLVDVVTFLDNRAEEEREEAKDIVENPEDYWPEDANETWTSLDDETQEAFQKQEVQKREQAEQEWKNHADRIMLDLEELPYGSGGEDTLDDFEEDKVALTVREQSFRNFISSEAALNAATDHAPSDVEAGKAIRALQEMIREMPPAMKEATNGDPANLSDEVGRAIFLYFKEEVKGGPKNLSRS